MVSENSGIHIRSLCEVECERASDASGYCIRCFYKCLRNYDRYVNRVVVTLINMTKFTNLLNLTILAGSLQLRWYTENVTCWCIRVWVDNVYIWWGRTIRENNGSRTFLFSGAFECEPIACLF